MLLSALLLLGLALAPWDIYAAQDSGDAHVVDLCTPPDKEGSFSLAALLKAMPRATSSLVVRVCTSAADGGATFKWSEPGNALVVPGDVAVRIESGGAAASSAAVWQVGATDEARAALFLEQPLEIEASEEDVGSLEIVGVDLVLGGGGAGFSSIKSVRLAHLRVSGSRTARRAFRVAAVEQLSLEAVTVQGLGSRVTGGAFDVHGGSIVTSQTFFVGNVAQASGGAVSCRGGALCSFANTTFLDHASNDAGGTISVSDTDSRVIVRDAVIQESASQVGGALFATTSSLVSFHNVTVRDAQSGKNGGCLGVEKASTIDIVSSDFERCTATENGGALIFVDSTLTATASISNSTFAECKAQHGAILFFSEGAELTVVDSYLGDSEATIAGGALFAQSGPTTARNVIFRNLTAGVTGGAVFLAKGKHRIGPAVEFEGNFAQERGGDIVSKEAEVRLVDVLSIDAEVANSGAHMFAERGRVEMDGVRVHGGMATEGGGLASLAARVAIRSSHFQDMSASTGGAIVMAAGSLKLHNSTFLRCSTVNVGGAVLVQDVRAEIQACNFTDNKASGGGAIYVLRNRLAVSDSRFSGNSGEVSGGAIYASTLSETMVERCTFSEGTARDAGAIFVDRGNLSVTASQFDGHNATGNGGAITAIGSVDTYTTIVLESANLTRNEASRGGAVYIERASLALLDCLFEDNGAVFGGAYMQHRGNVTAMLSTFRSNHVAEYGGALRLMGGIGTLLACDFVDNEATSGGAIAASQAMLIVEHSSFDDNWATQGGAVLMDDTMASPMRFVHSTFTNNTGMHGGGLYIASGDVDVRDSVMRNGNVTGLGGCIHVAAGSASLANVAFSACEAMHGGALFLMEGAANVTGCLFANCTARGYGGSVAVDQDGQLALDQGHSVVGAPGAPGSDLAGLAQRLDGDTSLAMPTLFFNATARDGALDGVFYAEQLRNLTYCPYDSESIECRADRHVMWLYEEMVPYQEAAEEWPWLEEEIWYPG